MLLQPAVSAARAHRVANERAIIAEFMELLALPNVSRDLDDVRANARAIQAMFAARGVELRLEEIEGAGPLVVGRIDTGAAITVGIYVHYDGQPVAPEEWASAPFVPTLCSGPIDAGGGPVGLPPDGPIDPEWRIYARSAADDKAPLMAAAVAIEALTAAGITPSVNVIFCFEGEEEIGSPHLAEYFTRLRSELEADVWLICDGPVHRSRAPQVVFGVRGITEIDITVYGPRRPLHSGHYGNWVFNPAMVLAQLVASMKDPSGTVTIDGFYDSTLAPTAGDLAAVAAVPKDDDEMRLELGVAATEESNAPYLMQMLKPSLNLRGLRSADVGEQARNVIPVSATASIDIRLAPGNDPDGMLDLVEAHIARQGFHLVDGEPTDEERATFPRLARVDRKPNYPGVRVPVDTPAAQAVLEAARAASGGDVIAMPTLGGSVPIHHFETQLGAHVIGTPFANHDNNQHAADENLRIGNLWYGIDLMAALMCLPLASPADS